MVETNAESQGVTDVLPSWLKSKDGKSNAALDPEAESVKLANGVMCNMIKKMKAANASGNATYADVEKYARESLDEHPIFKAAVGRAAEGARLAKEYGIPMWETVSAVKGVLTGPLDPFAYKALYEKLQEDYELAKKALGPERVAKIGNKYEEIMKSMKEKLGIPGGNTANCPP